ncbi:MAG: ABC transporter ATP-binding protein [Microbacterium sp.]|nr:ABC transporter ATP-binding protein [Microbacterium sp.]
MASDIERGREAGDIPGIAVAMNAVAIAFDDLTVLQDVDFQVEPGEFVCLLGPSGCGKSTLLAAIAGFVELAGGEVSCNGERVKGINPHAGVVFQSSEALFEWLTAEQNVAYGPRMHGRGKAESRRIATEFLSKVGLAPAAKRFPRELSGGMKQRVQIARVLANEPRLVLMDEPFGALDAQTRHVLQEELVRLWQRTGCSIVFVTHDIDESVILADRIVVMTAGPAARIKSVYTVDAPRPRSRHDVAELYDRIQEDIRVEVARSLLNQGLDIDAGVTGAAAS